MEMDNMTWEEPMSHRMKMERNLNFSTLANEEDEFGFSRKKTARDPMSHRIIEKRRRDRMNNCLADLSRLVPTNYMKKGRGRIEKTEIIEMAIKHLKHLQAHPCKDPGNCEVAKTTEQDHKRQYRLGFHECMSETLRFMVETEGLFSGDGVCVRLINHLQKHFDKVSGGLCYTQALGMMASEDSKSSIRMDIDNQSDSCYPSDTCSNGVPENSTPYTYENKPSTIAELKSESESSGGYNLQQQPLTPVKVTSQLREMLQNPGVPKTQPQIQALNSTSGSNLPNSNEPPHSHEHISTSNSNSQQMDAQKTDEGHYKFKNNIKHRFNNDLRHTNSSPTEMSADQMSLPDEDNKVHVAEPYPIRPYPQQPNHSQPSDHHLRPNTALYNNGPHAGHAFSPYPANHQSPELLPKNNGHLHETNGHYDARHWDSHAETASSCGSNPSPPPNTSRSNGSSSGYSTNGENTGPGLLKPNSGTQSPALSPYSTTPDRLSNRSPSPVQSGVPIFALHPKGTFYIPLTIDSTILIPYMVGLDDLPPVLHPISICVNLSSHSVKVEKLSSGATITQFKSTHSSFLMEKYHDRYVYPERQMYYPHPAASPPRNGCP